METDDQSASNIYYASAEKIARELGAVEARTYWVTYHGNKCRFSTAFFNAQGREIGHFLHDMASFTDCRTWCSDNGGGRVWCEEMKAKLEPEQFRAAA